MKKIFSTLLCAVMLAQSVGIISAEPSLTDVAFNKAVFSYNSVEGSSPSLAVDGDTNTAWESKGTGMVSSTDAANDYLVIDLGAAYTIASIEILPSRADSAQNIKIHGSNDCMNQGKTLLYTVGESEVTNPDTATDLSITNTTAFRYVVFEQTAGSATMGFKEIQVFTQDAVIASAATNSAPVSLMSRNKTVYASRYRNSQADNTMPNAGYVVDDDPSSRGVGFGHSSTAGHVFIDLGEAMPVSSIVYQAHLSSGTINVAAGTGNTNANRTIFKVVGTNDPSFADANCDVLVEQLDVPAFINGADTGMWVLPVSDTYRSTSYRYIGLIAPSFSNIIRLYTNTFQVYTKTADVKTLVANKGVSYIGMSESGSVTADTVSYTKEILNGDTTASLLGLFRQNGATGSVWAADTAEVASPGAYNSLNFEADVTDGAATGTTWELAILNGLTVWDYVSNIASDPLTRPAAYEGTGAGTGTLTKTISGMTVTANITAGAGVVGMLILEPNYDGSAKSLSGFTKDDIHDYIVKTAPAGATAPWNGTFSYTMEESDPVGTYTIGFFSDTGALTDQSFTMTVFDVERIKDDFAAVTAEGFLSLADSNRDFFGETLVTALEAANTATGTIGESFMLAKEGFTGGTFHNALTDWGNINTITAAMQAALVIDAALNDSGAASAIDSYGDTMPLVFGNADCDSEEFEQIFPGVIEDNVPTTAQSFADVCNTTIALSLILNGRLADKERALADYSTELGIADETLQCSHSLMVIADELSSDLSTVTGSYAKGMDTVIQGIIEALDDAADDDSGATVVGGRGGLGGGGGSISLPRDDEKTDTDEPEEEPEQTTTQDTEVSNNDAFSDIQNHGWAKDAIAELAERGILTGSGDGTFNPEGLLTREQAVKLLVLTLNLPTNKADNGYVDCVRGSWYYPYITAAKDNDLVRGIDRGKFGIGQLVTRQDLAVMIYRALAGKQLADGDAAAKFADDAATADYAKEAVGILGGMGLITGFTDGSFGPVQHTTRAQAAVIFARLLETVETAMATEEVAE